MGRKSSSDKPSEAVSDNRRMHEWALKEIFAKLQSANEQPVHMDREQFEQQVSEGFEAGKASQKKRIADIVRTTVNVLMGLNIILVDAQDSSRLLLDYEQALCIENVDHYCHALLLFEERNQQLAQEQANLVEQLISGKASVPHTLAPASSSASLQALGSSNPRNKKVKVNIPPPVVPNLDPVRAQHQRDEAVRRVRELQLSVRNHSTMVYLEQVFAREGQQFVPSSQGPMSTDELSAFGKDSTGMNLDSHHSGGVDPSKEYEIELKTAPIDFAQIASSFRVWDGQEIADAPGRTSPRPNTTPSPRVLGDALFSWRLPAPTPSPPPSVQVPKWTPSRRLEDEIKEYKVASPEEEAEEERHVLDATLLLTRHDDELERLRKRFEMEQEKFKSRRSRKEARHRSSSVKKAA